MEVNKVIKYERGKFLGKGGIAKCYKMKRVDTGKFCAVKAFALNNTKFRKKLINEIKLHKNLHHQNTVNLNIFLKIKKMYTSY